MHKLTLAAVADPGLVRLGAGIRKPLGLATRPPARKPAPASRPAPLRAPAAVVDGGKVRLGAGIRRA